jgi:hypothetical protein
VGRSLGAVQASLSCSIDACVAHSARGAAWTTLPHCMKVVCKYLLVVREGALWTARKKHAYVAVSERGGQMCAWTFPGTPGPVAVPEKPASAAPAPMGFSWTKPVAAAEETEKTEADKNGDEAKKPAESPTVNLAAATGHECMHCPGTARNVLSFDCSRSAWDLSCRRKTRRRMEQQPRSRRMTTRRTRALPRHPHFQACFPCFFR